MRGAKFGLTLSAFALTIASPSLVRAGDVGCCMAECHVSDGSGAVGGSATRTDMTLADCENRFANCERSWRPTVCDQNPDGRSLHMSPDVEER